jgi:hypothetical protein
MAFMQVVLQLTTPGTLVGRGGNPSAFVGISAATFGNSQARPDGKSVDILPSDRYQSQLKQSLPLAVCHQQTQAICGLPNRLATRGNADPDDLAAIVLGRCGRLLHESCRPALMVGYAVARLAPNTKTKMGT